MCMSVLLFLTSCSNNDDEVITREEKKTINNSEKEDISEKESNILSEIINGSKNNDEKETEKEEVDYKPLLTEAINQIYENTSNKLGLGFKLDTTKEIPVLYVMSETERTVKKYAYNDTKYELLEENLEYTGWQGYYRYEEIIENVINHYDSEEVPDYVWAIAYRNYLTGLEYIEEYTYSLAYLNEDDIPELICISKTGENTRIISWYKGMAIDNTLGIGGDIYYNNEDVFYLKIRNMEYNFYSIKNGKVMLEHSGKTEKSSVGEIIGYKWDDTYIGTETEYIDTVNDYYDISRAVMVDNDTDIITFDTNTYYLTKKIDIPEWKRAYLKYIIIDIGGDAHEYTYNVTDTDGDGTPELFAVGEYSAAGNLMCTYYDGNVFENWFGSGYLYYIQGENKYCAAGGRYEDNYEQIFHTEKGEVIIDANGWYGIEGTDIVDENGNYKPFTYKWNDEVITENTYQYYKDEAFDTSKAVYVECTHDKQGILSILTSEY